MVSMATHRKQLIGGLVAGSDCARHQAVRDGESGHQLLYSGGGCVEPEEEVLSLWAEMPPLWVTSCVRPGNRGLGGNAAHGWYDWESYILNNIAR